MITPFIFIIINLVSYFACKHFGMKPKRSHLFSSIFQNICQTFVFIFVDEGESVPIYIVIPYFMLCTLISIYFWVVREDVVKKDKDICIESQNFPVYLPLIKKQAISMNKLRKQITNIATTPTNPYVKFDIEAENNSNVAPMYSGAFTVRVSTTGFGDSRFIKYQSWQEDGEIPKVLKGTPGPLVAVVNRSVTLESLEGSINDTKEDVYNDFNINRGSVVNTTVVGFDPKLDRTIWAVQINNKSQKMKAAIIRAVGALLFINGMPLAFEVFGHVFIKTVFVDSRKKFSNKTNLRALCNEKDLGALDEKTKNEIKED